MTITIRLYEICIILLIVGIIAEIINIIKYKIYPWIINKCTKDVEINPKWLISKLRKNYYGFHDLDIIIVNSPLGNLPRFRLAKSHHKLQLLISEDVSTKEINEIAQIALAGKLKIQYGVWYPDKSVAWLSILNYMLDGGDINAEATKWEDKDSYM